MKRLGRRIGIGLSMLLLLLFVRVPEGQASNNIKPTSTPTPSATPTPTPKTVYQQVTTSRESGHADLHVDAYDNPIILDGTDCATVVVSFTVGENRETEISQREIVQILGWPDYDPKSGEETGVLNLGRGGEIVLDMNAYIRDSAGMFLYIFTTGKPEDKMKVELSADLNKWYEIEIKSRDFTGLDKYTNIPEGVKPRYVRITDCSKTGNGVSIDAVLAFDAEPIIKVVDDYGEKKTWYEKLNLSKKTAVILGVIFGSFVVLFAVLMIIRRVNIHKKRKSRRLRLVYSRRDQDGGDDEGE